MLSDHLRVLYLHGFASSPGSRKAQFFAGKLAEKGIPLDIPPLDDGDFEHLTITRQLCVIEKIGGSDPLVIIGSSLGGYLAALYAARHANVQRLLLLAPAFQFHHLWVNSIDAERLQEWRQQGTARVFHYGEGREVPLSYELVEDAARYEAWPEFVQPALIFHGTEDRSVPVEYSAEFVRRHPNARLTRMHSGHELTDVLDQIWQQSCAFLLDEDWNFEC
jgi:pimeloyl-ACP methyl ester carboxylesterase